MGEVNITPPPGIGLKKSKSLRKVFEECQCKKQQWKHDGSKNEGTCFFGDSLNKNILRKKIAQLLNEESSSHFEMFWNTCASKTYKNCHQEVFSKTGVLKILTSHNGLYKI